MDVLNGCMHFRDLPLEGEVGLPKCPVLILEPGQVVTHRACVVEPPLARALCAFAIGEDPFAPPLVRNLANVVAQPFWSLHNGNICWCGRASFGLRDCHCATILINILRGFKEPYCHWRFWSWHTSLFSFV